MKMFEQRTLSQFKGNSDGPNIGDSTICSVQGDILFEAKQISFELHHTIERAIRKTEEITADRVRAQISREILHNDTFC